MTAQFSRMEFMSFCDTNELRYGQLISGWINHNWLANIEQDLKVMFDMILYTTTKSRPQQSIIVDCEDRGIALKKLKSLLPINQQEETDNQSIEMFVDTQLAPNDDSFDSLLFELQSMSNEKLDNISSLINRLKTLTICQKINDSNQEIPDVHLIKKLVQRLPELYSAETLAKICTSDCILTNKVKDLIDDIKQKEDDLKKEKKFENDSRNLITQDHFVNQFIKEEFRESFLFIAKLNSNIKPENGVRTIMECLSGQRVGETVPSEFVEQDDGIQTMGLIASLYLYINQIVGPTKNSEPPKMEQVVNCLKGIREPTLARVFSHPMLQRVELKPANENSSLTEKTRPSYVNTEEKMSGSENGQNPVGNNGKMDRKTFRKHKTCWKCNSYTGTLDMILVHRRTCRGRKF